jgi:hypothetical protein
MTPRADRLYQSAARWLKAVRHNENAWRLRAGLRVCRLERVYKTGAVKRLALDTNIARSTLYEYADVWLFCWRWLGYSARRTFSTYPTLDYSHLRLAVRHFEELEDRIDAVLWAIDSNYTPEQFGIEIARWHGKRVPPAPLFDDQGEGESLVRSFLDSLNRIPNWRQRTLHITVRDRK